MLFRSFNQWPDTGELGVCWAPQELEGTISQETLHEAMTYLLVTIYPQQQGPSTLLCPHGKLSHPAHFHLPWPHTNCLCPAGPTWENGTPRPSPPNLTLCHQGPSLMGDRPPRPGASLRRNRGAVWRSLTQRNQWTRIRTTSRHGKCPPSIVPSAPHDKPPWLSLKT